MSGLDSKYIPLPMALQEVLFNKNTGMSLASGYVEFFKDTARTTHKDIFQLTETSPGVYTYEALPNPLQLSSIGSFQDENGNDIIIYLYPYDASGNEELYYVTVKDVNSIFQFDRKAFPYAVTRAIEEQGEFKNYIPNGQFYLRNPRPNGGLVATSYEVVCPGTYDKGQYYNNQGIPNGTWIFTRSNNSSTDYINFVRFGSPITNPTGNPRVAINIKCTIPASGQAYKDLSFVFLDVNKFASDTQTYTLFFSGQSNSSSSTTIKFYVHKYYGEGGSPDDDFYKKDIIITPQYSNFNINFTFGSNTGKTLGAQDGFVSITLRMPVDFAFDISMTDFVLAKGSDIIASYPEQTVNEIAMSLTAPMPNLSGWDLLLPLILTKNGLEYNDADIGKIFACLYSSAKPGEIECVGQTIDPSTYSPEGVPYIRLQSKIYNYTTNLPAWGTGETFVTALISPTNLSSIFINTNSIGIPTAASLGPTPPPFTLSHINIGFPGMEFFASSIYGNKVTVINNLVGTNLNPIGAGTSGFIVSTVATGNSFVQEQSLIEISSIATLAGTYFLISNTTTDYYIWFTVDGVGSDPAIVGRTGVEIDLLSTYSIDDVCLVIAQTLSGFYTFEIEVADASSITGGQYFNFYNSSGAAYYVYYIVDGIGNDPMVSGATAIPVSITTGETAADVASDTQYAINSSSYAIPDLRGMFLRGWNHGKTGSWNCDPDANGRLSVNGSPAGDAVGSGQNCMFESHNHPMTQLTESKVRHDDLLAVHCPNPPDPGPNDNTPTGYNGGQETRPKNIYVMYVMKY